MDSKWLMRSWTVVKVVYVPLQILTLAIVAVMFVFNVLFIADLTINHQALQGVCPLSTRREDALGLFMFPCRSHRGADRWGCSGRGQGGGREGDAVPLCESPLQ